VIVRDGYAATDPIIAEFTDLFDELRWTTRVHGGFGLCSIAVPMDLPGIWFWLQRENETGKHFAHVTVLEDLAVRYEGRVMDAWYDPGAPKLSLHIEAAGYWNSCRDQMYDSLDGDSTDWSTGANHYADVIIKEILTNRCPDINADQAGIEAASVPLELSGIDLSDRAYPQDIIVEKIPNTSDGTDQWYFAVWDDRKPYYSPRSITTVNWTTYLSSLAPGGRIGQNAFDMRNAIIPVDDGTEGTEGTEVNDATTRPSRYPKRMMLLTVNKGVPGTAEGYEADRALAKRKDPHQSQSFVIVGPLYATAASGERYSVPLWRVRAGDVIRIDDLLPFTVETPALDNLRTFVIIETSYNVSTKTLRVTPDRSPKRLSSVLPRSITIEPPR